MFHILHDWKYWWRMADEVKRACEKCDRVERRVHIGKGFCIWKEVKKR